MIPQQRGPMIAISIGMLGMRTNVLNWGALDCGCIGLPQRRPNIDATVLSLKRISCLLLFVYILLNPYTRPMFFIHLLTSCCTSYLGTLSFPFEWFHIEQGKISSSVAKLTMGKKLKNMRENLAKIEAQQTQFAFKLDACWKAERSIEQLLLEGTKRRRKL